MAEKVSRDRGYRSDTIAILRDMGPLRAATPAMTEAAVETVWRVHRRARVGQFPITDNLAALMALVMADLSESQRETLMNLIFQRGVDLTALTVQQLA